MQPAIDLYSAIMLLGAAQGMFLALALINAKGGLPVAQRLLAMLTLLFSLDLWLAFLHQSGYITEYPRLLIIDTNIDFLFGPLAYLYVWCINRQRWLSFRYATVASLYPLSVWLRHSDPSVCVG